VSSFGTVSLFSRTGTSPHPRSIDLETNLRYIPVKAAAAAFSIGGSNLRKLAFIISVLAIIAVPMAGGVITLTFEGLQDLEPIDNYYNGGLGGFGTGPGPNYGITFTPDSLALISQTAGGNGDFDSSPTMPTVAFFQTGAGDTMNVVGGFENGFSFYYSAIVLEGSVNVYDDLNGGGNLLATLDLPVTPSGGPGCSGKYSYCPCEPIGVSFQGIAKSVVFGGSANYIGFDNITLGASVPTPGVPEPSSLALLGGGLSVLVYRWLRG
jgi:hypothetical protein